LPRRTIFGIVGKKNQREGEEEGVLE